MRALADPYGRFLPSLLYHDVRDRMAGRRASADARWGRLSPPSQAGKLIWLCTGTTRKSVRLGIELAQAIVARCPDVVCTLTYEAEYPDLLAPVTRSARIGWGFGPADYVGSIHALWRRLMPFALIVAGIAPRRNLRKVAAMARHALLVAPPVAVAGGFERIYPTQAAPCTGANSAPAADLEVLLAQAETDPAFDAAIKAGGERRLWWWHGSDAAQALRFTALFRGHLAGDLLVLSGPVWRALAGAPGTRCLSAWDRGPIDASVLLADDPCWYSALGATAGGAHFAVAEPNALWQALAGGACVSTAGSVAIAPQLTSRVGLIDDETDVAIAWAALRASPARAQMAADASRRAFLAERRLAEHAIADLLDRVLAWN